MATKREISYLGKRKLLKWPRTLSRYHKVVFQPLYTYGVKGVQGKKLTLATIKDSIVKLEVQYRDMGYKGNPIITSVSESGEWSKSENFKNLFMDPIGDEWVGKTNVWPEKPREDLSFFHQVTEGIRHFLDVKIQVEDNFSGKVDKIGEMMKDIQVKVAAKRMGLLIDSGKFKAEGVWRDGKLMYVALIPHDNPGNIDYLPVQPLYKPHQMVMKSRRAENTFTNNLVKALYKEILSEVPPTKEVNLPIEPLTPAQYELLYGQLGETPIGPVGPEVEDEGDKEPDIEDINL